MEKEHVNNSELGLSIIPVSNQKIPTNKWSHYQEIISPKELWYQHYQSGNTVGIITGKVSGNLEIIDVDQKNDPTKKIIYCILKGDEALFSKTFYKFNIIFASKKNIRTIY